MAKAGGTSSGVTTSGVDTSGASGLVLVASWYQAGGALTVSDSKSNTWTGLTAQASTVPKCQLYYVTNPTVGSSHTFTLSTTSGFPTVTVYALSGCNTSTFYDGQQSGTQNSGAPTSLQIPTMTPSENNCIVVAGLAYDPGITASSLQINGGFSTPDETTYLASNHEGGAGSYLVQTTAAASAPTWSWSTGVKAAVVQASFRAAAAGGLILNPMGGPLAPRGFVL